MLSGDTAIWVDQKSKKIILSSQSRVSNLEVKPCSTTYNQNLKSGQSKIVIWRPRDMEFDSKPWLQQPNIYWNVCYKIKGKRRTKTRNYSMKFKWAGYCKFEIERRNGNIYFYLPKYMKWCLIYEDIGLIFISKLYHREKWKKKPYCITNLRDY